MEAVQEWHCVFSYEFGRNTPRESRAFAGAPFLEGFCSCPNFFEKSRCILLFILRGKGRRNSFFLKKEAE